LSETDPTLAPADAAPSGPAVVPADERTSVSGRDFRWFWAAYAVSSFGDQITLVALPLAVFDRTRSPLSVGIAASMQSLTAVALGILAGAYADRLRHRPILIATDVLRGVLLGAVALAVLHSDSSAVQVSRSWPTRCRSCSRRLASARCAHCARNGRQSEPTPIASARSETT